MSGASYMGVASMTDEEAQALQWSGDAAAIRWALKFSDECTEGVTRRGEFEPCDKTSVALRIDPEEGEPYPVCAYHSRGDMVPLTKITAALGGDVK